MWVSVELDLVKFESIIDIEVCFFLPRRPCIVKKRDFYPC